MPIRNPENQVELVDVGRTLLRGWRVMGVSFAVAMLGAVAVLRFASPVWTAHSSVLVRDASPLPSAMMQQLGGTLAGGAASALLGGAIRSSVETDIALLKSRELVGEVIDSLGLSVVVTSPGGTAPTRVLQATNLTGSFRSVKLKLRSGGGAAGGIRVTGEAMGKAIDTSVSAGGVIRLPAGSIQLASAPITPASLRLFDREDAVTRAAKRLDVQRAGGDVIGIAWPAEDSLSAPEAANLLVRRFLVRRRGVDRGLNERKLEFVGKQIDSTDRALDGALRRQRDFHERAQAVDMVISARAYLESLLRLREQRELLVMEEQALTSLQGQLRNHAVQPRQLAAYPAFLRSPGVNELLGKIGALEAERAALLQQQRRDDDPRIAGVRASVASLEAQLEPLARTYGESIAQQRGALDAEIGSVNDRLARLPNQVEEAFQFTREVERLSRTSLALNAQRVELRLATIGEGGEARIVDVAYPQWKRSFPSRPLTLIAGAFAGLAIGAALVLAGVGGGVGGGAARGDDHRA